MFTHLLLLLSLSLSPLSLPLSLLSPPSPSLLPSLSPPLSIPPPLTTSFPPLSPSLQVNPPSQEAHSAEAALCWWGPLGSSPLPSPCHHRVGLGLQRRNEQLPESISCQPDSLASVLHVWICK